MKSFSHPFCSRTALRLGQALHLSLLIGTCLGSSIGISYAGPEGGVVTGGSATIAQAGNNTNITQHSDRALIDWDSFNVGQNESVNFQQNSASSIAINRIHDTSPSVILGSLNANGQVMLINTNGVVFGNSAQVDVGGLVVSTAAPTDSDAAKFIAGQTDRLNLSIAGNPNAKIINAGNITARDAGLVGFVAPNVINNGIIIANKGSVQLASGDMATVDFYGDGLVEVGVSDAVKNQLIEQNGWVQADGGKVVITAAAGEQIVNSVINMGGVTQAHSIEQQDGKIILKGDNSTINVTGKIDASGKGANQKGGTITATAKHINLKSGSTIDASGDKGGGTIKIGGDYKGQGDLHRASTVTMEQGSTIYNDALTNGDGGTTILWSDDLTKFSGSIFGRGGALSGNGGFVETSGKKDLLVTGQIDLRASHGSAGTWLLDPTDITIYNRSQGGTDNVNTVTTSYLEGQNAHINLVADNNITLDLTGDTLTLGSGYNLTLTATNGDITTASAGGMSTAGSGGITLIAGQDISFAHDLDLTANGSGSVTLQANRNIVYSGGGDITTNGGTITLNSDRDATNGGAISLGIGTNLMSNGGNITLGGGNDPTTTSAIGVDTIYTQGIVLDDATIDARGSAAGGAIIMNGTGWGDSTTTNSLASAHGIFLKSSRVKTNFNGTVTLSGTGAGTSASATNLGVFVRNTTIIEVVNGTLSVTGVGGKGSDSDGVSISSYGTNKIQSLGSGNIIMHGTTGSNYASNNGFYMGAGGILSASGTISLTGNTTNTTHEKGVSIIKGTIGGEAATGAITIESNKGVSITGAISIINSGNITLNAGGYIEGASETGIISTVNGIISLTAGTDINITQDFDIVASGTGSVTERAGGSIVYSGGGDITTNGGSIILNSDRDASGGGGIALGSGTVLTSNGGNITLGGGADPTVTEAIGTATTYQGIRVSGATINANGTSSGGNIILNGRGLASGTGTDLYTDAAHGVFLDGGASILTSHSGAITITATGGGTGAGTGKGVFLYNGAAVTVVNGNLSVTGTGGGGTSSTGNDGIALSGVGFNKLEATGNGNITVTGTAGSAVGSTANAGIASNAGSSGASTGNGILSNGSGSITVTGIASAVGTSFRTTTNAATFGGDSASGRISLIGDSYSWFSVPAIKTSGDVVIRPYTNGTTIDIGTAGTGTLKITGALLNNINYGGTLWLGGYGLSASDTGYWNSAGTVTLNTTRSFARNVNFLSGGNIVSGGASTITLTGAANTALWAVGDILISHDLDITASGTGSVTERAGGNIVYSGSGDITTQGGAIMINSDHDSTAGGMISLGSGSIFASNGGNITLGGGTNPALIAATGVDATYAQGISLGSATVDASGTASGGHIIMNGQGWAGSTVISSSGSAYGILFQNSTVQTNFAGTLTAVGTGGGTGAGGMNIGVYVYNGSLLSTVNGLMSITGTGGGGSANDSHGVAVHNNSSKLQSLGSGNIAVNGTATGGGSFGFMTVALSTGGIFSTSGTITIDATAVSAAALSLNSGTIGGVAATGAITLTSNKYIQLNGTISTIGSGNITLNAGMNINSTNAGVISTVNGLISLNAADILMANDFDIVSAGTGTVTLRAIGGIIYSGSGDITTNGGHIILNSDRDATNGGAISLGTGTEVKSNGGHITLGGGTNPETTAAIGVSGNVQGINLTGAVIDARGASTTGGNITMIGQGWSGSTANSATTSASGVFLNGSTVQTNNSGAIAMNGTGGGTGASGINVGVFVYNTSSVMAVNGLISITGQGGTGTSNNNPGFSTSATGVNTIQSDGSGHITITGTGGTGSYGIVINSSSSAGGFLSASGNITLTGIGTGARGWIVTTGGASTTIGGTNATGTVNFIANGMSYTAVPSLQTTGSVVIRPYTNGTTVDIGTAGTGTLKITDTFLNNINYGGTLWLGGYGLNASDTGYWNSAGTVTLNTTRSFANNVNFLSGGNIVSGADNTITLTGVANTTLWALGDILISHDLDITASGTGSVTERAGGHIIYYSAGGDITTTGGNIILNSNRDEIGSGSIKLPTGTNLISNGGHIILGGGSNPLTGYAIADAGTLNGGVATAASINAGGGSITINGQGWADASCYNGCWGVYVRADSLVETIGNGIISINAIGGGVSSTTYNSALRITNATIKTLNGNINLYGRTVEDTGNAVALSLTGSMIKTEGTGSINITSVSDFTGNRAGLSFYGTTASTISSGRHITYMGNYLGSSSITTAPTITAAGDIIIRPYDNGITVGIDSGSGALRIADAFLDTLTWGGTLWLGGYGLTGAEAGYWNSAGNLTLNTTRSFANNVNFLSGGNIVSGSSRTITLTGAANTTLWALGDILISHDLDITASGTGSVTERAGGSIAYSGSGDITTNGGHITLNSDRDAMNGGAISLGTGTNLMSNGGNITLGGGGDPTTESATGLSDYPQGIVLSGATLNANGTSSGGNIILNGKGWANSTNNAANTPDDNAQLSAHGVFIKNSSVIQTNYNGTVTLKGATGGAITSDINVGVYLHNGAIIRSVNGLISIAATSGSYGSNSRSFSMSATGVNTIESLGSGDIDITANAGTGFSVYVLGTNDSILNNTGNITITANNGTRDNQINGIIGSNSATGHVTITSTRLLTLGGSITTNGGAVSLTAVNGLSLPSITASSIFARTTGATADITIGSGKVLTSSGSGGITLVAGRNFINQAGSTALAAGGSGRWLVYSTDVTGTTGEEDLTNNFNRYSCSYSGGCATGVTIPGTGNGLIYSYTPVLTVTPTGVNVTYGNAVTGLSGYAYNVTGYLGSDAGNDVRTGSLTGTTDYVVGYDVDTYGLNYSSGSLLSSLGYGFTYANKADGVNVTARVLTAALTGTVTKVYDGNDTAALVAGNYTLSNIYNGDNVSLGNLTSGSYADKNAGNSKNVTVNGLTLAGTKAGNYVLASNSVTGAVGTITPKGLTVTATAGQNKTYGDANGVLGYTYTGLASGDSSASFSGALSRSAGENAGLYGITQGNLSATGNYTITSFVASNYTINKATINIIAPNGTRYYGDANPVFDWSDATITGLVNGQTGSVLDTLSFNVAGSATSNAGTSHAVTLGTFSDNNYILGGFTDGVLTINKALLTIYADDKVRPSSMPMPTLTASYSGLRNGETGSVVSGLVLYTAANAGSPAGSYAITASGASAANYDIGYVDGSMLVLSGSGALPPTVVNPAGVTQTGSVPVVMPDNQNPLFEIGSESGGHKAKGLMPLILWDEPDTAYSFDNALVTFTPELREILGLVD